MKVDDLVDSLVDSMVSLLLLVGVVVVLIGRSKGGHVILGFIGWTCYTRVHRRVTSGYIGYT